jgi:hypothetical protein
VIPDYLQVARRIKDEVQELERTTERARRGWDKAVRAAADQDVYVDSVALNLHGFYSGIERLFELMDPLAGGLVATAVRASVVRGVPRAR